MKLNINILFITIFIILITIFTFFRPLNSKQVYSDEIAQLELQTFKMYEMNQTSTKIVARAQYAYKYSDRYEMLDMNIDEKSHGMINHIQAGFAKYSGDFLHLERSVRFTSHDGVEFSSERADYNQSTRSIIVNSTFKVKENKNYFEGNHLNYNLETKKLFAKDLRAVYNLDGMKR